MSDEANGLARAMLSAWELGGFVALEEMVRGLTDGELGDASSAEQAAMLVQVVIDTGKRRAELTTRVQETIHTAMKPRLQPGMKEVAKALARTEAYLAGNELLRSLGVLACDAVLSPHLQLTFDDVKLQAVIDAIRKGSALKKGI